MAIINSMGVGRSRKSMGNVTYRTVRGRTIGSQKRGSDPVTRVPNPIQEETRTLFRAMSMYVSLHRADINVSFDKTKYGSQGNYFMKVNKEAIRVAIAGVVGINSPIDVIVDAIETYATANPTSIYRVRKSGYPIKFLTGEWKSSDNPTPPVPPTGVTLNGVEAQKSGAFIPSTSMIAPVDKETAVVITDSGASFTGITASQITGYGENGNSLSDSVSIKNVVANAKDISFTVSVAGALDGGAPVHALKIGTVYYQYK